MNTTRTLADVHAVPLVDRARIVRELCAKTGDVDERWEYVGAAFLPPPGLGNGVVKSLEDENGWFMLDLGVAS